MCAPTRKLEVLKAQAMVCFPRQCFHPGEFESVAREIHCAAGGLFHILSLPAMLRCW